MLNAGCVSLASLPHQRINLSGDPWRVLHWSIFRTSATLQWVHRVAALSAFLVVSFDHTTTKQSRDFSVVDPWPLERAPVGAALVLQGLPFVFLCSPHLRTSCTCEHQYIDDCFNYFITVGRQRLRICSHQQRIHHISPGLSPSGEFNSLTELFRSHPTKTLFHKSHHPPSHHWRS